MMSDPTMPCVKIEMLVTSSPNLLSRFALQKWCMLYFTRSDGLFIKTLVKWAIVLTISFDSSQFA